MENTRQLAASFKSRIEALGVPLAQVMYFAGCERGLLYKWDRGAISDPKFSTVMRLGETITRLEDAIEARDCDAFNELKRVWAARKHGGE
jgi:hypothetical protein